jgi:hypothetical protein
MEIMKKFGLVLFLGFIIVPAATGQATRTWVSGVGDDANPCSRTAPCKTFAGAISKTAAGGEINVLDPGGFGGVTITKSITISSEGFEAGVLVSGTNAIIVNAGANDVVVLRGLDIEGLGTGLNGIRFLAGKSLIVDNCLISDFRASSAGFGIDFAPSTSSQLLVKDTLIIDNGNTGTAAGGGIQIKPTGAATVKAVLDNVRMHGNVVGARPDGTVSTGGISVTIRNSEVSNSANSGITPISGATAVNVAVEHCSSVNNGSVGVKADGAGVVIRLHDVTVTANATGLQALNSGQILTFGNNFVKGNTADGVFTGLAGGLN